ncbi:PrsW family glutamic-type intramembrane protease [Dictyobacter aurantiacus]|uniref:PrsW family glutamic-type intramembrane protease n=1 Tax=Dictyobacter aurantiacus TaxID=1936993 RepID=UPI000F8423FE|nr:PrsW family glutamic-type intramembrane protease [Dictyobacter aurantiacus]
MNNQQPGYRAPYPAQPQPGYGAPLYPAQPYPQPGYGQPNNGYGQPYSGNGQHAGGNGWASPYQHQPMYNNYAPQGYYQPYNGYYHAYGYPPPYGYPYTWQPPKPARDTYQFVVAIIATICSSIVFLTGIICAFILLITVIMMPYSSIQSKPEQLFGSITMFTALSIAGLGGGTFSLYHSIRALLRKKSWKFKVPSIKLSNIRLPWFVVFLVLYIVMVAIGLLIRGNIQVAQTTWLTVLLIGLAGLLPALTIFTLGAWRINRRDDEHWTTTWRRVAVALTSGATSAILFAMIFELILGVVIQAGLHLNGFQLDDPNMPIPNNTRTLIYLFLVVSVVAPLVEEGVKPLAVVVMIRRIGSAAEAFLLGMACGIGFDLVETSGYIGMGYSNWVDIAIQRSSAGLLHSFGAGMTALGWYYLTHSKSLQRHRIWIGLGCGAYAVLQHAIWNGSFAFQLLPAPVGPYFDTGTINIGNYPVPSILIIYTIETILMVLFFLFVTGKLRKDSTRDRQPGNAPRLVDKDKERVAQEVVHNPSYAQPQPYPAR